MSLEVWIIDELEREPEQGERPRPELDLEQTNPQKPAAESCSAVQRGVRILDISPTHDNELDL